MTFISTQTAGGRVCVCFVFWFDWAVIDRHRLIKFFCVCFFWMWKSDTSDLKHFPTGNTWKPVASSSLVWLVVLINRNVNRKRAGLQSDVWALMKLCKMQPRDGKCKSIEQLNHIGVILYGDFKTRMSLYHILLEWLKNYKRIISNR